jgi:hypothetical protein
MTHKPLIVWLDDYPHLLDFFRTQIINAGFSLLLCTNLIDFRKALNERVQDASSIKGIILDCIIPENNLGDLGFPNVLTSSGFDTGYCVYLYYLRNFRERSELSNMYEKTPIILLSAASNHSLVDRYQEAIDMDDNLTIGSKSTEYGEYANDLSEWLHKIAAQAH